MSSEVTVYKLSKEEIEKRYGKINKTDKSLRKSSGFKEPYWTTNKNGENLVLNVTKVIEHISKSLNEDQIREEYPEVPVGIVRMLYEKALKYQ